MNNKLIYVHIHIRKYMYVYLKLHIYIYIYIQDIVEICIINKTKRENDDIEMNELMNISEYRKKKL